MLCRQICTCQILVFLAALVTAHPHSHATRRSLPQKRHDARIAQLFKRQSNNYPSNNEVGPQPLQAWVDKYNQVRAAGRIPAIPVADNQDGWPVYPNGVNTADPSICSFSLSHCSINEDLVDAPDGHFAIAFDDGPQQPSTEMYDFLQQAKIPSTHFMIGSRIMQNPDEFQQAFKLGGIIAAHTWSHPLLSTLNDSQILGELGWTLQIIHDMSGGFVPAFYRPPYGDCDNRVRAIASNVFGLTNVLWNHDSRDWCLQDNGQVAAACGDDAPHNDSALAGELQDWLTGGQSPGLMILQHEHHNRSISAFINSWPLVRRNSWSVANIPDTFNMQAYLNAASNTDTPRSMNVAGSAGASAVASVGQTRSGSASAAVASASATTSGQHSAPNTWQSLSHTARYAIIGGASGAAGLILLVLGFCLARRCRKRARPASTTAKKLQIGFPLNGAPMDTSNNALPTIEKAPYVRFDESRDSLSLEKDLFGEKHSYPDVKNSPPDLIPLKDSPPPKAFAGASNLLAVPTKPAFEQRNSTASVYSQHTSLDHSSAEDDVDPFRRTTMRSPAPARKSAFHLPNRMPESPYAAKQAGNKDWL